MRIVALTNDGSVPCVRQGENGATALTADIGAAERAFPGGTAEMLYRRADGAVYPLALTKEDTRVTAVLSASETAAAGEAALELQWRVPAENGQPVTVKSRRFRLRVLPGLAAEAPDLTPPWADRVFTAADRAEAAQAVCEAVAESIPEDYSQMSADVERIDGEVGDPYGKETSAVFLTTTEGRWFKYGNNYNWITNGGAMETVTGSAAASWRVGYGTAVPGKTYRVTFQPGGSTERHYLFFSGDNVDEGTGKEYNVVYQYGKVAQDAGLQTVEVTAPEGTTKIWVSSNCEATETSTKLWVSELSYPTAFEWVEELWTDDNSTKSRVTILEGNMTGVQQQVSSVEQSVYDVEDSVSDLQDEVDELAESTDGKFDLLKERLYRNRVSTLTLSGTGYTAGYMLETTGGIRTTDTKHMYSGMIMIYGPVRVVAPDAYLVSVNEYNRINSASTSAFVQNLVTDGSGAVLIAAGSRPGYIMIGLKRRDGADIAESDLAAAEAGVMLYAAEEQPQFASISMFPDWAVTGCSWDAGSVYNSDAGHVTLNGLGWAENVSRRNGMELSNYAVGGTSIRTWYNWEPEAGQPDLAMKKLLADDARGLYVLIFGSTNDRSVSVGFKVNDENYSAETPSTTTYYVGTLEDITLREGEGHSCQEYPCTFYGYFGRIIEMIEAHAPRSKIIVSAPSTKPSSNAIDKALITACQEIAEHYGLPYMEIRSDPYYPIFINLTTGNHPTPVTYSGWALAFERLFAKTAEQNVEYFRKWSNEPTTVAVTWEKVEL